LDIPVFIAEVEEEESTFRKGKGSTYQLYSSLSPLSPRQCSFA